MIKSALYVAALAVLTYMLYVQVTHLGIDIGIAMAAAIILGINVGWSLVFELLKQGVWLALVVTPILLFGNHTSIESSQRAFAQNKHQKILDQSANPVASMHQTQMIIQNNVMVALAERGIGEGAEFDDAMRKFTDAERAYKASSSTKRESAAELALKGGDPDKDTGEVVQQNSGKNAWLLELMCVAMSILCGLGDGVSKQAMGVMGTTKKPQGHARAGQ